MNETLYREYQKEILRLEGVILNPDLKNRMNSLFYDYFRSIVTQKEQLRNYFLVSAAISKLLQVKGKDVLDIGSGFGLRLICLALVGSRRAVGIDISKEMIEGFQTLLKEFPELDISAMKGDFLLADFRPSSFDVVILQEAISHIRDTQLLLAKIRSILRPGGTLYIRDSNNDLFIPMRMRSRKFWKKSEFGPIDQHFAEHGREVDRLSFFEARVRIIRQRYPHLEGRMLALIAGKTQGMYGEEIIKSAQEFIATGRVAHKASFPYRNPFTGEFPELGINPLKLVKELKKRGFQCRFVRPAGLLGVTFGASSWMIASRLLLTVVRSLPSNLFLYLFPNFQIMAVKVS